MTIADGHQPDNSPNYAIARQRKLRRTLETFGVLTREGLRDACHAEGWEVAFETALARAVKAGRVRELTPDLFEAGPEH